MMRCLRCALDYPPEERYCHRCGRALSRPPGTKISGDGGEYSTLQDTQYMYSTYSPPSGEAAQAASEREHEATPVRPGLPPSAALARSTAGKRIEPPLALPSYTVPDDEDIHFPAPQSFQTPPALPGSVYIEPPAEHEQPPTPGQEHQQEARVARSLDEFDDEDDVLAAFRVKPAAIGIDAGSWRKTATRQRAMPNLPLLRRGLLIAVAALAVLLAGGALALWRHGIYAADVRDARQAAQAAQYAAAIAKYQAAVDAWPFNADAKDGLAGVQASATAVAAAATAAAVQAQAQVMAVAERREIYSARAALRQQIAMQTDADANATATAVAQAQTNALAAATATAQAQAAATVQARATASAQARAASVVAGGDVSSVVRLVMPSVVRITVSHGGGVAAVGTGIVFSNAGAVSYIVTNAHVLQGGSQIVVTPQSGAPIPVAAQGQDATADLAVLRVGAILPPATWSAAIPAIGQPVVAIGYAEALNGSPTVTSGILSAAARADAVGRTFIQHTAPINPGNSGGPLVDLQGHVLGINTFSLIDTQGLFFAIPASRAQTVAGHLISQMPG